MLIINNELYRKECEILLKNTFNLKFFNKNTTKYSRYIPLPTSQEIYERDVTP